MFGRRPVTTSNNSPVTRLPSLRTSTTPSSSVPTSVTVASRCTSHRFAFWSVNRFEISASSVSIKVAAISTMWISTPKLEKTCANSTAMCRRRE